MEKYKKKNIDSIQALRAWAFLGVFASHTGIRYFKGMGAGGVSVFFILSGFLMTYNYYGVNRIESVSLVKSIRFAWNKMRRLYPLHIVTMLAALVFSFVGESVVPISQVFIKLFVNLSLLQCWVPIDYKINGPSWYLCTSLFLYFLFPHILKHLESNYSVKKAKRMMIILFFIEIVVGFVGSLMPIREEMDLTRWFVYYFPPMRVFDFGIGCNLGYCFVVNELKEIPVEPQKTIFFELFALGLIIAANICHIMLSPKTAYGVEIFMGTQPKRWWTYTFIFTISSCMIIWLFAKPARGGVISKYLINRVTRYIGNISSYSFLIHWVVFRYIEAACNLVLGSEFQFLYGKWIKFSVGFILTIAATQVWLSLVHKKVKF